MTSTPVRLLIVDQSLRDMAGHHYEYDVALFRAAASAGVATVVGAHASVQPLELLGGNVRPWFQKAWYESQSLQPAAVPASHRSLFARARAQVKGVFGGTVVEAQSVECSGSAFGQEVLQLLRAERFTPNDHLLVHTFSVPELDSLIGVAT